jgi:hypothetical protein
MKYAAERSFADPEMAAPAGLRRDASGGLSPFGRPLDSEIVDPLT